MFDFLNEKDRQPPALPEGTVRRRYSIEGQVQGVGFRYRARYAAQSLGLTGWVENEDDGSVTTRPSSSSCSPSSSAATISRSPRSASATSPPTHGSGISGCAAAGKRLL